MWGWIPQAYYDFLARVIPGGTLILVTLFVRHGADRGFRFVLNLICEEGSASLCRLGIGILASYLVGLIIGGLGELLADSVLRRAEWALEDETKNVCLEEHNRSQAAIGNPILDVAPDALPSTTLMREQLRIAAPNEASRLLKLSAERRLCQALVLGLGSMAVINLLIAIRQPILDRLWIEFGLVLLALVLWRRSTRLTERLVRDACVSWLTGVSTGRFTPRAA